MKELVKLIGKSGLWSVESVQVEVKITDVRKAYGRTDYEIEPTTGNGSQWVSSDRVKVTNGKGA